MVILVEAPCSPKRWLTVGYFCKEEEEEEEDKFRPETIISNV